MGALSVVVHASVVKEGLDRAPAIFRPLHEGVDVGSAPPTPDDAVVLQLDDWQRGALRGLCKGMGYGPQRQLEPCPDCLQV